MNDIVKYLDGIKSKMGISSDNQFAIRLGVSQATVQTWMKAGRAPNDDACIKIAEFAGDDPARVIALAHMFKAKGDAKKAWTRIFKAVAAAALGILLTLSALFPLQAVINVFDRMYIMLNRARRLLRSFFTPCPNCPDCKYADISLFLNCSRKLKPHRLKIPASGY